VQTGSLTSSIALLRDRVWETSPASQSWILGPTTHSPLPLLAREQSLSVAQDTPELRLFTCSTCAVAPPSLTEHRPASILLAPSAAVGVGEVCPQQAALYTAPQVGLMVLATPARGISLCPIPSWGSSQEWSTSCSSREHKKLRHDTVISPLVTASAQLLLISPVNSAT
jgi:hypothetical protein